MTNKKIAVIICAAGPGSRFAGKKKKQFTDIAGRAVFIRSLELFTNRDDVKQVILAISPEDQELVEVKWGPNLKFFGVKVCLGGAERFETVSNALEHVSDDVELVAIHDAARCCVTSEVIDKVFTTAAETSAAIPACPVIPTIKKGADNKIIKTIDRSDLYEAQTPQVFELSLLKKAYDNLENLDKAKISDDAQLVEALGEEVTIVPSDSSNIKITYPMDIHIAEAIIKNRRKSVPKGYAGPYSEAKW